MYRIIPNFKSAVTRKPKIFLADGSRLLIAGRNLQFLTDEVYESNKTLLSQFPLTIEKVADTGSVVVEETPLQLSEPPVAIEKDPIVNEPAPVVESTIEVLVESPTEVVAEETKKSRRPRKSTDE